MTAADASVSVSLMRREILEIPETVDHLLAEGSRQFPEIAASVRALDPRFMVTIGRGSSDHVCTFLKYAVELSLGVPVASVGPSVSSVFGRRLRLHDSVVLAVSQSGSSPDIVSMARSAQQSGAELIAFTNDPDSPLARVSTRHMHIHAGCETSVPATKTFVASLVACLMFLAEWTDDEELRAALHVLPDKLSEAIRIDWPEVCQAVAGAPSLYTLGRGPTLAISDEAALKFKEVCGIHAESFSGAEVLHGPVAIVDEDFPVLALVTGDAAEAVLAKTADRLAGIGAQVFVTTDACSLAAPIGRVAGWHPLVDPICLVASLYAMVEQAAVARGGDPDQPRHLQKITETI